MEEQESVLPDIPYTGIVFTMPRDLWDIFKKNRHLLHDLPALGAAVIEQWTNMKYGARPLTLVVQHTFGGDLKFNCHLHILMSSGALRESTRSWIPQLYLNKDAVMKMWRYTVIDHLRCALKAGILRSDLRVPDFRRLLSTAYSSQRHPRWIIHLNRIVSKAHFLAYAARYVRRPSIAKRRILEVVGGEVVFVAKETKRKELAPTRCTLDHFVRLLAAHAQNHYRHAIRYFGLLAPRTKRQQYAGLFVLLGQQERPKPPRLSWRESLKKCFGFDPMIDSFGQEMYWI